MTNTDSFRYDLLAQDALRSVVRTVLADAAKTGLPGDHHFFITFETSAPGTIVSPRLKAKYPDLMTIIIQHQFWDFVVTDTGFGIGLSFSDIPERLTVPFMAIKNFYDPEANFELEFEMSGTLTGNDPAVAATIQKPAPEPGSTMRPAAVKEAEPKTSEKKATDVVSLDSFRKKP